MRCLFNYLFVLAITYYLEVEILSKYLLDRFRPYCVLIVVIYGSSTMVVVH